MFFAEQLGHLVLTRMEDIEAVFTNPDVFASTNVQDPLFPLAPEAAAILAAETFDPIAVMSNRPEPDHGRIRVLHQARLQPPSTQGPRRARPSTGHRDDRGDARFRVHPLTTLPRWPSHYRRRSSSG